MISFVLNEKSFELVKVKKVFSEYKISLLGDLTLRLTLKLLAAKHLFYNESRSEFLKSSVFFNFGDTWCQNAKESPLFTLITQLLKT